MKGSVVGTHIHFMTEPSGGKRNGEVTENLALNLSHLPHVLMPLIWHRISKLTRIQGTVEAGLIDSWTETNKGKNFQGPSLLGVRTLEPLHNTLWVDEGSYNDNWDWISACWKELRTEVKSLQKSTISGVCMCLLSCSRHVQFWDPIDHSPPGSFVHGILQARILEWVTMPSSRGSFWPQGWNPYLLHLLHWQVGS